MRFPPVGDKAAGWMSSTGNPTMRVRSSFAAGTLLVIALLLAGAAAALPATESEPTLPAQDIVPKSVALSGEGYRIDSPTAVKNFLGQFSIRSDWGVIDAAGSGLLVLRIAEMPALAELDKVSHTDVFAKAIADSAGKTIDGVVRVTSDPVGTVKGIPAGVGRLLSGVAKAAAGVASAVGTSGKSKDGDPEPGGLAVTDYAKEYGGLNRARRALAKSMGIDPYTGNRLVQQRLEELAWTSVAGAVPVSVATSAVSGVAGTMLKVTRRLDSLVWDLSPEEIKEKLEPRLIARGNSPELARSFLRNTTFTPTLQLLFVDALERLGAVEGEEGLLRIASGARSEAHAWFLIQQLRMIRRHAGNDDPVREVVALEQSVVARLASGRRVLALPVDYFSWTTRIAELAERGDRNAGPRELIVSGIVSPAAASAARELGWRVSGLAGLVPD
jgi:hypothetical protein